MKKRIETAKWTEALAAKVAFMTQILPALHADISKSNQVLLGQMMIMEEIRDDLLHLVERLRVEL